MSFLKYYSHSHDCLHALAGSVVGQVKGEEVVGEEEVVEMMGIGAADELAQLNLSGHVWHVHCPSNEYSPWGHGC